jgi:hypothetical protein
VVRPPARARKLVSSEASKPASETTQLPPIQRVPGALFQVLKEVGREGDLHLVPRLRMIGVTSCVLSQKAASFNYLKSETQLNNIYKPRFWLTEITHTLTFKNQPINAE